MTIPQYRTLQGRAKKRNYPNFFQPLNDTDLNVIDRFIKKFTSKPKAELRDLQISSKTFNKRLEKSIDLISLSLN